jgi:hypothetical protein
MNNIMERVRNMLLTPKTEWSKIDAEPATPQSLFTGYVMILAAIGPIVRIAVSLGSGIVTEIVRYAIALAVTLIVAFIVDALAPSFGGTRNFAKSLALVAYSWTAAWVAAIVSFVPVAGALVALAALIYAFYTFYLGAAVLGRASADKAAGFTIVVALCAIVVAVLLGNVLSSMMLGAPMMGMGSLWV